MMYLLLNCLLTMLGLFAVPADTVFSSVRESQKSVLLQAVHTVSRGLESRVCVPFAAPKPGAYMPFSRVNCLAMA